MIGQIVDQKLLSLNIDSFKKKSTSDHSENDSENDDNVEVQDQDDIVNK